MAKPKPTAKKLQEKLGISRSGAFAKKAELIALGPEGLEDIAELKRKRLVLQNEKLEIDKQNAQIELAKTKGEFRSIDEIAKALYEFATVMDSKITAQFVHQAAIVNAGLSAQEQRVNLEKIATQFRLEIREWASKWEPIK